MKNYQTVAEYLADGNPYHVTTIQKLEEKEKAAVSAVEIVGEQIQRKIQNLKEIKEEAICKLEMYATYQDWDNRARELARDVSVASGKIQVLEELLAENPALVDSGI